MAPPKGLDVLVIESNAPGGQASANSKIENYLDFPNGISGRELAGPLTHAQKFGAQVMHRDLSGMPNLNPTTSCRSRAIVSRCHQLGAFPDRCPRMTCSTNSSPNRLVNGPERNKKR